MTTEIKNGTSEPLWRHHYDSSKTSKLWFSVLYRLIIRISTKLRPENPIMTISGAYDVIIYFSNFIFRVFEHKKSAEGGLFSSFWLDCPLYCDNAAPFELNCFCCLIFSIFFFLTSIILSFDRLVRLESLAINDCWFT